MRFHNITKEDMLNGDGLRVVLWVSGCAHGCKNCQNPITWDPNSGLEFNEEAKAELFQALDRDFISGLTLSGGDPLFPGNRETITQLVEEVKEKFPTKTIWLYTGYLYEEIKDLDLMKNIDILVDGPFVQALFDSQLHWKGSSNQRTIDVNQTRKLNKIVLHDQ